MERYEQSAALLFLGKFTLVQYSCEFLAAMYFRSRTGDELREIINRRLLTRATDDDRRDLVLAITTELESNAPTKNFAAIFNAAKAWRDRMSHGFLEPRDDGLMLHRPDPHKPARPPERISFDLLSTLLDYTAWLSDVPFYAAETSGIGWFSGKPRPRPDSLPASLLPEHHHLAR